MATRRMHMSLSVEGALRQKMFGGFEEDGKPVSKAKAKAYLEQCKAEGKKVIPMCSDEECPDFDYQKGCPGHPIPEQEPSSDH